MAASLDPATLREIEKLISESLGMQEKYRQHEFGRPFSAVKIWAPLSRAITLFPDGTFTTDHSVNDSFQPYGKEALLAQTEVIWAFSNGSTLPDLDCPQKAVDLYQYFCWDLYQFWHRGSSGFKDLCSDVTNNLADWRLITHDTTSREGLENSPRAGMAAHAFIVTNGMTADEEEVGEAKRKWESRCGSFTVVRD